MSHTTSSTGQFRPSRRQAAHDRRHARLHTTAGERFPKLLIVVKLSSSSSAALVQWRYDSDASEQPRRDPTHSRPHRTDEAAGVGDPSLAHLNRVAGCPNQPSFAFLWTHRSLADLRAGRGGCRGSRSPSSASKEPWRLSPGCSQARSRSSASAWTRGSRHWRASSSSCASRVDERSRKTRSTERKTRHGYRFILAPYIVIEATRTLVNADEAETSLLGIGITIASLVTMPPLGIAKNSRSSGQRLRGRRSRVVGSPP